MRKGPGKLGDVRGSSRRTAALAVAIGCHLGLLMLLLRPAVVHQQTTWAVSNSRHVLRLRFIRLPRRLNPQAAAPLRDPTAAAMRRHQVLSASSPKPAPVRAPAPAQGQPSQARLNGTPTLDNGAEGSAHDGGFLRRLEQARHTYDVHGVPGTDEHVASGIQLIDPASQGLGAVMRTAQRAFGIPSSHCIDVDVWRHLAPRQLGARHVSPGEVDRIDKEYHCHEPPGLHF